jgi:hypothetical protein
VMPVGSSGLYVPVQLLYLNNIQFYCADPKTAQIHFEDLTSDFKEPYTGVPFINIGMQQRHCEYGTGKGSSGKKVKPSEHVKIG